LRKYRDREDDMDREDEQSREEREEEEKREERGRKRGGKTKSRMRTDRGESGAEGE